MSLISDALKTAQRQRSDGAAPRPEIPVLGGFFPDNGHRRDTSARWRGAAAGGAIGLLLVSGAIGVREWRAMHTPAVTSEATRLPPLPAAKLPVTSGGAASAAVTRHDSTAAAKQQGERARVVSPPVGVAFDNSVAERTNRAVPGATVQRPAAAVQHPPVRATTPANSPVAAQTAAPIPVIPPAASGPATNGGANGVHVSVQGGARDAADRLLEQARGAQREGNDAAAEDVYNRAVATHQANAEIYNNYAALLADRGDTAGAISKYKLALALDPTYVDAWSNLGMLFDASGDHRQATGVFQQVLRLDSTNATAREGLAEQYQALGDVGSAIKLLEQVTRQAPDYARAHYTLAVLLDSQHDTTGATREYSLFLQTGRDRYPQAYSDRVRARISVLAGGKKP
jgi:Tfp pilus assembly protein PilF